MRKAIGTSLLLLATGCSYLEKRALDFSDIVDLRYGLSAALREPRSSHGLRGGRCRAGVLLWEQEWFGGGSYRSQGSPSS